MTPTKSMLDRFKPNHMDTIHLMSCHPKGSLTWHWYVAIAKTRSFRPGGRPLVRRAIVRTGQWHDYIRLFNGYDLVLGHQDYHKRPTS